MKTASFFYLNMIQVLAMRGVTWNRFPIKILRLFLCLFHVWRVVASFY